MSAINAPGTTAIYLDWVSVGGVYDPSAAANYGSVVGSRNFGADAEEVDFDVDNLKLVPEPTSIALLGLSLAGLGFTGRRRAG